MLHALCALSRVDRRGATVPRVRVIYTRHFDPVLFRLKSLIVHFLTTHLSKMKFDM